MTTPQFSISVGGNIVYAKMPGGSVKLPLAKKERDETIAALREALSIFDDVSPRDDAKVFD